MEWTKGRGTRRQRPRRRRSKASKATPTRGTNNATMARRTWAPSGRAVLENIPYAIGGILLGHHPARKGGGRGGDFLLRPSPRPLVGREGAWCPQPVWGARIATASKPGQGHAPHPIHPCPPTETQTFCLRSVEAFLFSSIRTHSLLLPMPCRPRPHFPKGRGVMQRCTHAPGDYYHTGTGTAVALQTCPTQSRGYWPTCCAHQSPPQHTPRQHHGSAKPCQQGPAGARPPTAAAAAAAPPTAAWRRQRQQQREWRRGGGYPAHLGVARRDLHGAHQERPGPGNPQKDCGQNAERGADGHHGAQWMYVCVHACMRACAHATFLAKPPRQSNPSPSTISTNHPLQAARPRCSNASRCEIGGSTGPCTLTANRLGATPSRCP